jgi:hypothetical protein
MGDGRTANGADSDARTSTASVEDVPPTAHRPPPIAHGQ